MTVPNWTLKTFAIKDLKDYHKNPRKLTKEQYQSLKQSLTKFGLIDKPICTQDGMLIGGHQRKNILKGEGIKEVECYVPDRELTPKEIEELNIRHNKNTGEWDYDMLANEFDSLELVEWGFDAGELMGGDDEDANDALGEEQDKCDKCETCGQKIKKKRH